jgi:nucleotide-binding universal stress UspA family protein
VLAGVDGHHGGRDAIALASVLLAPCGQLTLAHVRSAGLFPSSEEDVAVEVEEGGEEYEESQRLLERERARAHVDAALLDVVSSSVGRGLHELVGRRGEELLVVGSCHHKGFLGRVLLSDDTRDSLNGAPCAVAVAPLGYERTKHRLETVGVAYDASPESQAALALARELAADRIASLRALRVVPIMSSAYSGFGGVAWGEALETVLTDCKRDFAEMTGLQGNAVLGIPGEELAAFSAQVDLLVVGSRGCGPMRRVVLGSTSQYLAQHARCPLLVLSRSAAAHAEDGATGAS